MVSAKQWIVSKRPSGPVQLDGPDATFKVIEKELPALSDGQLLVKPLYMSNDPAQRMWIDAKTVAERTYRPPVMEGEIMATAGSVCEVLESKSDSIKQGDKVIIDVGWSNIAVVDAAKTRKAATPHGIHIAQNLGALGGTGLTAYFGLIKVGEAKAGDVVVVSGAAGATGSMVVQIAKHIVGCKKVIGIAGSKEKCDWVKSLGADECLDYRSPSFKEDFNRATPDYANLYYDNVGGEILDYAITRCARHARIVACGAISGYDSSSDKRAGIKNWHEIITMSLQVRGFIVIDHLKDAPEALGVLSKGIEEGKIQVEGNQHLVETSFEDIPKTWMQLFSGKNTGKLVTVLK